MDVFKNSPYFLIFIIVTMYLPGDKVIHLSSSLVKGILYIISLQESGGNPLNTIYCVGDEAQKLLGSSSGI